MRIVIYDDRESSASRHRLQVVELGRPDAYRRIRIPPGTWYAFACVGSSPSLLVNCTDLPHDPGESDTRLLTDPAIPYAW